MSDKKTSEHSHKDLSDTLDEALDVVSESHSVMRKWYTKLQNKVAQLKGTTIVKITILGCSGGIGSNSNDNLRTTSILVDDDVLIDAGTGVGDLTIDQLMGINHVFITHSHLDHIACLPLLIDTVMGMRPHPVTVYATAETLSILKEHIFNWKVWPDFNQIPDKQSPFLLYKEIRLGEPTVMGRRKITAIPANHVVPAVGYHIDSGKNSFVFTGDTTSCDALWEAVNKIQNLKYLIIETAFSNAEERLATLSKHLCPSLLAKELAKMTVNPEIFITHLKPGEGEIIMQEIEQDITEFDIKALSNDQEFYL